MKIRIALNTLSSLLSKVIISQSARVRKLKTNRPGKSRIAEAEWRLEIWDHIKHFITTTFSCSD